MSSQAMLWLEIIPIAFLILLCAFFAGSETAFTAASKAHMHTLAKEGNKGAIRVNKIHERKDKMVGALLLGNTLVNILGSALATSFLIQIFGDHGVFYATAIMTVMILIFGEVLPKTYAIHNADKMAMATAPLVQLAIFVFSPITSLVARIVRVILRVFGADLSKVSRDHHIDVLRGAIDLHEGHAEETEEQRAMLHSILDLGDVVVNEVMIHRKNVLMIDVGQPTQTVINEMLESPYTRIPIWKDNPENILGVVHVKSLLKELQAYDGKVDRINMQALASDPWFVPENTSLFDQLQAFRQRREHFALVVDEYGTFKGIVTLEDILEEIVGDIDDEMDEVVAGVRRQPNGSLLISGTLTIRDLNREFGWNLPDDKGYSTLAGLVLHESQVVPDVGQIFHFFDMTFEVVRRMRNQVTLVRVTPQRKADGETAPASASTH